MISTGTNDLKRWNLRDKKYARDDFLAGNSLEAIGKKCNRHAKNVCIELMRQGLIEEKDDISKNHIRFESGSDTCSEYTPSEDDESDDESDTCSEYTPSDGDSEYEEESEYETNNTNYICESDTCSEYTPSEDEDYDLYNIEQNIDNIYKMIDGIKSYISNIRKV